MKNNIIFLIVLLSLITASSFANITCLDQFDIDWNNSDDIYASCNDYCTINSGGATLCYYECDVQYQFNQNTALSNYSDCCCAEGTCPCG